jgi:hypothetical protein
MRIDAANPGKIIAAAAPALVRNFDSSRDDDEAGPRSERAYVRDFRCEEHMHRCRAFEYLPLQLVAEPSRRF